VRALERRDEDRAQVLAREAHRDRLGLRCSLGRERRIAVPVEQRERLARTAGADARAGRGSLGGARRQRELTLMVGLGHRAEYHNAVVANVTDILRSCYSHVEVAGRSGARGVGVTNLKRLFGRPARAAAVGRGAGRDGRRRRGGRVVGHRQLTADRGRRLRAVAARGVRGDADLSAAAGLDRLDALAITTEL
jgi:hypothetical protein